MNNEPKILLTITMEGGSFTKGEKEIRKYLLTKKDLFPKQRFKENEGKKVIKVGKYAYYPAIPTEVKRKITMCKEAYDYMTSREVPDWFIAYKPMKVRLKEWGSLTETARLEMHLSRTCLHFGGKSFSYQIIDD